MSVQAPPRPARVDDQPATRGLEARVTASLRRFSVPLLRVALGVVFAWFGALKVAGLSPVGDLVAGTVPWFDSSWFVPTLGVFEVALGLLLISGRLLGVTVAVMVAHLAGTFLVFIMQPGVAFDGGNPLLITTEGEFVAKNFVLISAGLAVAAWSGRHLLPKRLRSIGS